VEPGLNARVSRRNVLLLGMTAPWQSALHRVSLVPLYTDKWKTVSPVFINAVIAALKRTYTVTTSISEPECYEGRDEAVALLDFLSKRRVINGQPPECKGRAMGIMSGPIRARVDGSSSLRNVCGFAYTPNDEDEYPAVTVITNHEFNTLPEEHAAYHLGIVAIHELGHNFGAWDCNNRGCFMSKEIELSNKSLPSHFCSHHSELLWQYLR
jgi:hypothetical protein